MSEIIRVEDPPVLRFGKHRGKSAAEVMAMDPAYVEWMLAQPWFQEKNPQLVQFFVNGGKEPSETPEHNALQAKFTQDAYCLAVAAMFSSGHHLRTANEAFHEAESMMWPGSSQHIRATNPSIENRRFELDSWDVRFEFMGSSAEVPGTDEPDCSCEPLSDQEDDAATINMIRRMPGFEPASVGYWSHLSWEKYLERTLGEYTTATRHDAECPRATIGYVHLWVLKEPALVDGTQRKFGLELKPVMGDDYPAVLRQVHGYLARSKGAVDIAAVVVGEFRSEAVPWAVVKKQFWESSILLIQERELDDLVEQHADEWGASLIQHEADFPVDFVAQL